MKKYRKRIADEILRRKLEGKGAVLIEGPRWRGKTTTAGETGCRQWICVLKSRWSRRRITVKLLSVPISAERIMFRRIPKGCGN